MKKINVITPTVRPEMLSVVQKCLSRQTFHDFSWTIVTPLVPVKAEYHEYLEKYDVIHQYVDGVGAYQIIPEPLKNDGDYYGLTKAYNEGFRKSGEELIVSIQDGLWFPPTLLESFWNHYQSNPQALVGAVGNQYDQIVNGKPEHQVWVDPRKRTDFGSFYEVSPREIEYTICSIPRQAIVDVGGMDEEWDKYAALCEKEMNARMDKLGYKFYLDQGIEYRAIKHPRLSEEWDKRYEAGCIYYQKCLQEIDEGKRLRLDFVK